MPPSALAGRRLADVRLPAETIGEDSAARLAVKAMPFGWRSTSFRASLDACARGGAAESPISAGLAALSERPGLGARPRCPWLALLDVRSVHALRL